jgi:TetR/AcrR family transcriptional regulator
MISYGRSDGESSRRQILKGALPLFAARGYRGTTLRAVAKACGVSQPLIHHHFGTKRKLWDALRASVVEDYGRAQAPQFAMTEASRAFLDDGLRTILRWYQENPQHIRLGLWAHIEGDASPWPGQNEQHAFIVAMLTDAQAKGLLRDDVPAFHLSMAIGGMAYYWFLFKRRYAPVGAIDADDPRADEAFFASLRTLVLAPPPQPPNRKEKQTWKRRSTRS